MLQALDPWAIEFTEGFGLRWYGLSYLIGFILAYLIIRWLAATDRSLLKPAQVLDFITYMAVGVLAGGRLGYCLFYAPELFTEFTTDPPFWGVLALNKGGMASHGGIIGLITAGMIYSRKDQIAFLHSLDLVSLVGPIGVFFGRLANFINGELVGRPAPAGYPWAIRFPQDIYNWPQYSFAKLQSLTPVVKELGVSSQSWSLWLSQYGTNPEARSQVIETLKATLAAVQNDDRAVQRAIEPLLVPRYPAQLYAAVGEGLLVFLILVLLWRKPRRPGLIASVFFMSYAVVRIWTEQFRLPDVHIGYQLFDLTRGQWLSIALFGMGLGFFFWWRRCAPSLTVGGWSLPADKK